MTVANSVTFAFTWLSVPMQTFNFVFFSDSAIIACLTASLIGSAIVSPVNFLQIIIYFTSLNHLYTSNLPYSPGLTNIIAFQFSTTSG
jgi:hypothetical protein